MKILMSFLMSLAVASAVTLAAMWLVAPWFLLPGWVALLANVTTVILWVICYIEVR